jgi:hypothetical protein
VPQCAGCSSCCQGHQQQHLLLLVLLGHLLDAVLVQQGRCPLVLQCCWCQDQPQQMLLVVLLLAGMWAGQVRCG